MAMTKLGALWKNKNGKKVLTGNVEIDGKKTKIVIFPNGHKEEEKHPDYIIYLSEPMNASTSSTNIKPDSLINDDIDF